MTPKTFPKGAALRVFWVDSTQIAGWRYADQLPVHIEKIITLGWVVGCSAEGIGLSTTIAESGSVLSSVMIPWAAIVHIQELNEWDRDSNLPDEFIDF